MDLWINFSSDSISSFAFFISFASIRWEVSKVEDDDEEEVAEEEDKDMI